MAADRNGVTHALSPLRLFYLISATSASLSKNNLLYSWPYRIFLIVTFVAPTLIIGHLFYEEEDHMKFSPLNYNIMCIYYIILHYMLSIYPIVVVKKMRVQKVVQAIEEMDFRMRFKNCDMSKKIRCRIIIWLTMILGAHMSLYIIFICVIFNNDEAFFLFLMSSWQKIVELAMDMEMFGVTSMSRCLYYRADSFLQLLDDIVQKNVPTDLNLLLCHRQLHFVLKKINKAWKLQISVILYIITFQALRNLLSLFLHLNDYYMILIACMLVVRYLMVIIPLCIVGQQIANTLDQIHVTANIMKDSSTLSREHVLSGYKMSLEGQLRVRRLCGLNGLNIDAKLPLKVLASVGTILVFILQLRIDVTTHNL